MAVRHYRSSVTAAAVFVLLLPARVTARRFDVLLGRANLVALSSDLFSVHTWWHFVDAAVRFITS